MPEFRHVLSSLQFTREDLSQIFALAEAFQRRRRATGRLSVPILADCVVVVPFYQPSTRTRTSFEVAAQRLGASVSVTENAKEFSSTVKGESLEDSIRVLSRYGDAIILRHDETGSAERAAKVSRVPLINAGDGKGEHPTQAALDQYTIFQLLKDRKGSDGPFVPGLQVAFMGDLKYGRTVRSLARLLANVPVTLRCISLPDLRLPSELKRELESHPNVTITEHDRPEEALAGADVVYVTRTQTEHIEDEVEVERLRIASKPYRLSPQNLAALPASAIILHPLPRDTVGDELPTAVDADPRAKYFDQAENGLYVRMALLCWVFQEGLDPSRWPVRNLWARVNE